MIITVTMNPALDQTIYPDKTVLDPGGKGINVSKVLKEYGVESLATGFNGGEDGKILLKLLQEQKIACDFVKIAGNIRTNKKLYMSDGTICEQNAEGPTVSEEEYQSLKTKILHLAGPGDLVILSGSLPGGITDSAYGELIRMIRNQGGSVFLDASGEALLNGVHEGPDFIKPNEAECVELMSEFGFQHEEPPTLDNIHRFGQLLTDYGIQTVIVSCGEKGAAFITLQESVYATAPTVEVSSTVGAGDALTAAYAMKKCQNASEEEAIKFAMAAAVGAVTTEGTKPASYQKTMEFFNAASLHYL